MSDEPGSKEKGDHQERVPTKIGPREALAKVFDRAKNKVGIQSREFGYDAEQVTYKHDHLKTYGKTDMGIQAEIGFDGTQYEKAFDNSIAALKKFAASGTESTNWRGGADNSSWGQLNKVELPNGHKYEVIDETRADDKNVSVSIRKDGESNGRPEGAYYLSDKGHFGGRNIEICGAKMDDVSKVMEDIESVVEIAVKG